MVATTQRALRDPKIADRGSQEHARAQLAQARAERVLVGSDEAPRNARIPPRSRRVDRAIELVRSSGLAAQPGREA